MNYSLILEGVACPIVSAFGLLGNILSIIIFHRRRSISPQSGYISLLICLAIFDSLFLIFANGLFCARQLLPYSSHYFLAIPFLMPLASIALTGSVYTVVAISVERYATLKQSHTKIFCAKYLIFFITLIAVMCNVTKFFELRATIVETEIEYEVTLLRSHPTYFLVYYLLINLLTMTLIPLVLLTVLNIFILRIITQITQKPSDTATTTLLFSIVIVFLICHSPKVVLNIYEGTRIFEDTSTWIWPVWAEIVTNCSHLLLVINSSINIVIFMARDHKFRQALLQMLQCKKRSMEVSDIPLRSMTSEQTKEEIVSEQV